MRILALDTSFGAASAAIAADGRILASRLEPMERGHAERLVPIIDELMRGIGIAPAGLDLIAVANGPGTFTGLRVAVAAAEGLSLATGLPLAAASSLAVMAARLGESWPSHAIVAAADARRGQCYAQIFEGHALRPLTDPMLAAADDVVRALPRGKPLVAIGSAAEGIAAQAAELGLAIETGPLIVHPDAADLALMAPFLPRSASARPLYLRAPDAKPQAGGIVEPAR